MRLTKTKTSELTEILFKLHKAIVEGAKYPWFLQCIMLWMSRFKAKKRISIISMGGILFWCKNKMSIACVIAFRYCSSHQRPSLYWDPFACTGWRNNKIALRMPNQRPKYAHNWWGVTFTESHTIEETRDGMIPPRPPPMHSRHTGMHGARNTECPPFQERLLCSPEITFGMHNDNILRCCLRSIF